MNHPARTSDRARALAPTAAHKVRFGKESRPGDHHVEGKPIGRVPRVARLLALAHRVDGMIRSGELKNWTEAARRIGVTRARMTQIANLLLLAPEIQEEILNLAPRHQGQDLVTEHDLRGIVTDGNWREQHRVWLAKIQSPRADLSPVPRSLMLQTHA